MQTLPLLELDGRSHLNNYDLGYQFLDYLLLFFDPKKFLTRRLYQYYVMLHRPGSKPILSVDNKYPVPNRCNIMQHIQVQLSQKRKIYCEFFFTFPKFRLYFEHFQKKDDLHS